MRFFRAIPGRIIALLAVLAPALLGFQGCESEEPSGPGELLPRGSLISASGCKDPQFLAPGAAPANLGCLAWVYDGEGTLSLTHVNAGLNCCPGTIRADIFIDGDSITVTEDEGEDGYPCRCLCLYDLGYEITGLEAGTYTITFVEENLPPGDEVLAVTVDLSAEPEGSRCLPRSGYPWGMEYPSTGPTGTVTNSTGCFRQGGNEPYSADESCVWITYDLEDGHLSMSHTNAALNCCVDSVIAEYTFGPSTVIIEEREYPEWGMCDCICLHTVHHEIFNLEPGVYTFRFLERYLAEGDEILEFTVDLERIAGKAGPAFCVKRSVYPWGLSDETRDRRILDEMYDAIIDYIGIPYCQGEGDCRAVGVGSKPCGGAWEYLVYSASTLDEEVLRELVEAHAAFEGYMNEKYGYVSTCDVPPVPGTECAGGVCAAVYPPPADGGR